MNNSQSANLRTQKSDHGSGARSAALRILALGIEFICIAVLIWLDRYIKSIAVSYKGKEDRVVLQDILSLTYTENTGMAWGLLSGATKFITILTVLLLGLLVITLITGFVRGPVGSVGMVMIIAGGVGNVIDRLRLGYVVDYIRFDFINFPVFNFADILVVIGVILFAIWLIITTAKDDAAARDRKIGKAKDRARQKRELLNSELNVPVSENAPVYQNSGDEMKVARAPRNENGDN